MPPTQGTTDEVSSKKQYTVTRSAVGINSVNSNVITIDSSHKLLNGETVRIQSDTGEIPDGLEHDVVYFAITSGTGISSDNQLKLARTLNDAISDAEVTINSRGGTLTVEIEFLIKNLETLDTQFNMIQSTATGMFRYLQKRNREHNSFHYCWNGNYNSR